MKQTISSFAEESFCQQEVFGCSERVVSFLLMAYTKKMWDVTWRICDYTADDLRGGVWFSAYIILKLGQLWKKNIQFAAGVAGTDPFGLANTVRLRAP